MKWEVEHVVTALFVLAAFVSIVALVNNRMQWIDYYEYRCEYKQIGTDNPNRTGIVCQGKVAK